MSVPQVTEVELFDHPADYSLGKDILNKIKDDANIDDDYVKGQAHLLHKGVGFVPEFDEEVAEASAEALESPQHDLSTISKLISAAQEDHDFDRVKFLAHLRKKIAHGVKQHPNAVEKATFLHNVQKVLRRGAVDEHYIYAKDVLQHDPVIKQELDEMRELAHEIAHPYEHPIKLQHHDEQH